MAISFKKVGYKYPLEKLNTLNNINLEIKKDNEFIFILGSTGAGKTTLLEHFNALKRPTRGNLTILGHIIKKHTKLQPIRKNVGLVFQFPEYQLFEDTVINDLMFGPKNFKELKKKAETLALKSAALLGISDELLKRSPFKLSGGEMRKVAIAGVLATNPQVIVLDEPTRGLDNFSIIEVMNLLYKINNEGKSVIVVSHDLNLAVKYAKRIIIIKNGEIAFDNSKEDFLRINDYNFYGIAKPPILVMQDEINNVLGIKKYCYYQSIEEYINFIKNG